MAVIPISQMIKPPEFYMPSLSEIVQARVLRNQLEQQARQQQLERELAQEIQANTLAGLYKPGVEAVAQTPAFNFSPTALLPAMPPVTVTRETAPAATPWRTTQDFWLKRGKMDEYGKAQRSELAVDKLSKEAKAAGLKARNDIAIKLLDQMKAGAKISPATFAQVTGMTVQEAENMLGGYTPPPLKPQKGPQSLEAMLIDAKTPEERANVLALMRQKRDASTRASSSGGGGITIRYPTGAEVLTDVSTGEQFEVVRNNAGKTELRDLFGNPVTPSPEQLKRLRKMTPSALSAVEPTLKAQEIDRAQQLTFAREIAKHEADIETGKDEADKQKARRELSNTMMGHRKDWLSSGLGKKMLDTQATFMSLDNAYTAAKAAIKAGKRDVTAEMKALYKFIQGLDNSVVRSSETESFVGATPLSVRFSEAVSRLGQGSVIAPEQLDQIMAQATADYRGMRALYDDAANNARVSGEVMEIPAKYLPEVYPPADRLVKDLSAPASAPKTGTGDPAAPAPKKRGFTLGGN